MPMTFMERLKKSANICIELVIVRHCALCKNLKACIQKHNTDKGKTAMNYYVRTADLMLTFFLYQNVSKYKDQK
jgi:hypothetical protein